MGRNIKEIQERYDQLREELSACYKLYVEYEALLYKPPSQYAEDITRRKINFVKDDIARKEHELEVIEKLLARMDLPMDPVLEDKGRDSFDQEEWLKKQREEREKERQAGRSFTPEK